MSHPERSFRKTAAPGFYNLRFKASQGIEHDYFHFTGKNYGSEGFEAHQTERDPTKFKYSNNLFNLDYFEYRQRASDYLYQISTRLYRSNDSWTRTLVAYSGFCFLMANQALFWKLHLFAFGLFTTTRIRDRGAEPTIDEVWVLDTIQKNPKISSLFNAKTWHIIDYNQEWDRGTDNAFFPEYKSTVAKFFNTDCNTTTGFFKFGDVETGATMTLNFKTMPYANNRYNMTEPFYVYDMQAEISHNGEFEKESLIKPEEVFKTKRIFVPWH